VCLTGFGLGGWRKLIGWPGFGDAAAGFRDEKRKLSKNMFVEVGRRTTEDGKRAFLFLVICSLFLSPEHGG